ncbi:hypothetical protein AMR41_02315 [Hapalosiphon sp. MRB220]|nr:hypothetical protein AMR41_02315 [Hapalosiphon sp. MRB220]
MEDLDRRKLLSALSHGAIFFSSLIVSIGIPIAILYFSNDPVVKENAKESLNFHINLYIYALIFGLLSIILVGIPFLIGLWIISLIMPIIAIVRVLSETNIPYRYPYIFRLI